MVRVPGPCEELRCYGLIRHREGPGLGLVARGGREKWLYRYAVVPVLVWVTFVADGAG